MKPRHPGQSMEEERRYRRGFDQGFYSGLRAAGLSDQEAQGLALKQQIREWRHGWREIKDPVMFVLERSRRSQSD